MILMANFEEICSSKPIRFMFIKFYAVISFLCSQMKIDFTRIKQPKVHDLLKAHDLEEVNDFASLNSCCYHEGDAGFHSHSKSYSIKADIEKVWKGYCTIHPRIAWNGKMISFGALYCKVKNELVYQDDPYKGAEVGQIFFVGLNILSGILKLGVAHVITDIDEENKRMKICYLEKGKSVGSQFISLHKTADGFTKVIHDTKYKSDSAFRDRVLYPALHSVAVGEYHQNVKNKIESEK